MKNKILLTESYEVRFWMTNSLGFKEQATEVVRFNSKGKHQQAEKQIITKYRKLPFNQQIEIISVTYQ